LTAFSAGFVLGLATVFALPCGLAVDLLFGAGRFAGVDFLVAGRDGFRAADLVARLRAAGFAAVPLREADLGFERAGGLRAVFVEFLAMVILDRHGTGGTALRRSSRAVPERWGRRGKTSNYSSRVPLL
jgi:hypothetical protein